MSAIAPPRQEIEEAAMRAAFERWRFLVRGNGDWLAVVEAIRAYLAAAPRSAEPEESQRCPYCGHLDPSRALLEKPE